MSRRPADRDADSAELDAYIAAGTAVLGIPVRPEWHNAIRQHLAMSFRIGALVTDFPLPDDIDPAPVFTA